MKTMKLPHHPVPENLRRAREGRAGSGAYPCVVCGLPVARPRFYVHMIEGGGVALHPDFEATWVADGGDMGLYPVGPECLRRHPELKPYLHKA